MRVIATRQGAGDGRPSEAVTATPRTEPEPPPNTAPVAHAGADQTLVAGEPGTLNGTASRDDDDDPLTYAWTQAAGTTVVLSDATAPKPTFIAPPTPGELVFSLVVHDGTVDSEPATVTVTVTPAPVVLHLTGALRGEPRPANAQQPRGAQAQQPILGLDPVGHLDAGQEVELTLTATAAGVAVSPMATYQLEVTGGRGVTLTGAGVTDHGDGRAHLNAMVWLDGQRTVVLRDTVGTDTLSVTVLDATGTEPVAALEPPIVYHPDVPHRLLIGDLPDTLVVGYDYWGSVSVADLFGNRRADALLVALSANQAEVALSEDVRLQAGAGRFWVRSDALTDELLLSVHDRADGTLSGQSNALVVRLLDPPDAVAAADYADDEGGFITLQWDLSADHALIDGYRLFRESADGESTEEWAWVEAEPGAVEGRAVVATLDTVATRWGVAAERGGPAAQRDNQQADETLCVEITLRGEAVAGLTVEVWRGSSPNTEPTIFWQGITNAAGQVSLSLSRSKEGGYFSLARLGGYYQAQASTPDGTPVGQWTSIPLNPNRCHFLTLTLGDDFQLDVESPADAQARTASADPTIPAVANYMDPRAGARPSTTSPRRPCRLSTSTMPKGRVTLSWNASPSDSLLTRRVEGAVGPVLSDEVPGVVGYRLYRRQPIQVEYALLGTVGPR